MDRVITIGKTYRHFKGKNYKVLFIALDSETNEEVVVYEALYGKRLIWTMPYEKFASTVDNDDYTDLDQKYRFEQID